MAIEHMADPVNNDVPSDDVLTAYLDEQLEAGERRAVDARLATDAATRARLTALAASNRPYPQAFALVLDAAPRDRLVAMIESIAPRTMPKAPRRVWATAAAIALFATGVAIGIASRTSAPTITVATTQAPSAASTATPEAPAAKVATTPAAPAPLASATSVAPAAAAPVAATTNWRQVVAEYLVLTTPDTLAVLPNNPTLADAVLAYGGRLQLDVSADRLAMPMAMLKEVRLFDYRGRPLIQAEYLSDDMMAVAFCIILNGQSDAPPAYEEREGQNIVFWTAGGHGYMVAGKLPRERLEAVAKDFAARFL
jgi:anti-sigma factor RsiW